MRLAGTLPSISVAFFRVVRSYWATVATCMKNKVYQHAVNIYNHVTMQLYCKQLYKQMLTHYISQKILATVQSTLLSFILQQVVLFTLPLHYSLAKIDFRQPTVATRINTCLKVPPKAGSEIALSWSPMRLKILHRWPEFHSWSTTFSNLATEKKGQSPVGACLKELISDPEKCDFEKHTLLKIC